MKRSLDGSEVFESHSLSIKLPWRSANWGNVSDRFETITRAGSYKKKITSHSNRQVEKMP